MRVVTLRSGRASPRMPAMVCSAREAVASVLFKGRRTSLVAQGLVAASLLLGSTTASATEPWADADPSTPPVRTAFGDYGIRPGAEYRANWLYINPISLNSENDRRATWVEHRLRLDSTVDYQDKIKLVVSADVMDGVLWGDNGTFTGSPQSKAGTNVGTRNPNNAVPCIGYRQGDALQRDAYGYKLCEGEMWKFRKLYVDVSTPIGLLRIGRQPINIGMGVQNADGDGRANRFGFARAGNYTDRVMFATKPLEAFKPADQRDKSIDRGFFFVLGFDKVVQDEARLYGDDVNQIFTSLRWLIPEFGPGRDGHLSAFHAYRWDTQNETKISVQGARAYARFGSFSAGFDVALNLGSTQEVAKAYKLLTNDPVTDQTIRQLGARAVARYDRPAWSAYLEFDYASGDPDPTNRTDLTQFVFAEDVNVGLLLFKHTLGFQTARAAAAGVETLRRLGATSYPAEQINTRGAFTNAIAIFPQFDLRPHKNVLFRGGMLVAWAASKVNDPIASLSNRRGVDVENDLLNYVGGKPGKFYGYEIDGRFQWRFMDHFAFDLEGAYLIPGDALQNQDGKAVNSVMVQGRSTVFF